MDIDEEEGLPKQGSDEFDCVICSQKSPSTAEKPIGLVILLQPSSGNPMIKSLTL